MLLSERLMRYEVIGSRIGLLLPPERVPLSMSDLPSIVHYGVPQSVSIPWQSAAGGVSRDENQAILAALGEGIERLSASTVVVNIEQRSKISASERIDAQDFHLFSTDQRLKPNFPFGNIYNDNCPYAQVYSLVDNSAWWVPQPLVTLQDDYQTGIPTSSGLAAGPTAKRALLRGVQEIIERDALMVTWLHGLPGRRVKTDQRYIKELSGLEYEVYTFDITPAYSPFAVVAVAGGIKKDGKWRYSLGVACRESWGQAEEKAYLEWHQGVLFAGIYDKYVDVSELNDPYTVRTFDEHAMYYTVHPEQWHNLAIFGQKDGIHARPKLHVYNSDSEALSAVQNKLSKHGLRVYYKDITTIDAEQAGVSVVRVLSPDMAMIFAHQEWPFIDRVDQLLGSRYPRVKSSQYPYLMPHPLG